MLIKHYEKYFVLDDKTGDLFIRSDLLKHMKDLKGQRIWSLLKIMSFNSNDPEEIKEHNEDIKLFNKGKDLCLITRSEFNGMRNALMSAIIERDGYYCKNCNSTENITIDHIVPVSKGGKNILSNLQLLCRSCNSKKGAK